MVVEVERTLVVDRPVEEVWEVLADPERRAEAISVVESYRVEGQEVVWEVALPIPVIDRTVSVRTRDVEREPPTYVHFTGDSAVFSVEGEHELEATDGGTRIRNRFVVNGKLPGVERFFERNIDDELDNLMAAFGASRAE